LSETEVISKLDRDPGLFSRTSRKGLRSNVLGGKESSVGNAHTDSELVCKVAKGEALNEKAGRGEEKVYNFCCWVIFGLHGKSKKARNGTKENEDNIGYGPG